MKLQLANAGQDNVITAYGDGFVQVNTRRVETSVLVSATLLSPWAPTNIRSLQHEHFEAILEAKPEIVIVGTGREFHFPAPVLLRPLIDARIGYEVMDTRAACRTYNILLGESRNVLAALIVD